MNGGRAGGSTCYAADGMVAAADARAAQAGVEVLARGGNAVDAAIAAGAVAAVTLPHMSGLGGDLFAIVHREGQRPVVLNASGRAPSGVDSAAMRSEGRTSMPLRGDMRSVTAPGCVDGWVELQRRFGSRSLGELLRSARDLAQHGFVAGPELFTAAKDVAGLAGAEAFSHIDSPESEVRAPGMARDLSAIMAEGRAGFYEGAFADDLVAMTDGLFTKADLKANHADWVSPLRLNAFGHEVWATPPNTPGYVVLAAAWLAERLDLPREDADPRWVHLLVEAVRQASFDRRSVLFEGADGADLVSAERLQPRLLDIEENQARVLDGVYAAGDTTYLCAVDGDRTAVSLIQSIAKPFGSHLFVAGHDTVLNNRGVGFALESGHPAELRPGARPPHTLSPLLVTTPEGKLKMVLGTMGGDAQPQVLLQLLLRALVLHQLPDGVLAAPRWSLSSENGNGFDTWNGGRGEVRILLEADVPAGWRSGLEERGHQVEVLAPLSDRFGHASLISVVDEGLAGASDPRAASGGVRGYDRSAN